MAKATATATAKKRNKGAFSADAWKFLPNVPRWALEKMVTYAVLTDEEVDKLTKLAEKVPTRELVQRLYDQAWHAAYYHSNFMMQLCVDGYHRDALIETSKKLKELGVGFDEILRLNGGISWQQ
jgi:hypothetical protein